ncbi:MAG: hypothetical protein E7I45_05740, partial [Eikenella corrodens]|uniref:hypothetical protein n=1 Tax=Eikenella corrodens TaxID=539 RepID=UPI00291329DA
GLCGLLEEGAHEKSPKCLGWKFRGFWGILQRSRYAKDTNVLTTKRHKLNIFVGIITLNFQANEAVFATF